MFTGIVEDIGRIAAVTRAPSERTLVITAPKALDAVQVGDSIAVNGVCLTVTEAGPGRAAVTAVAETLDRTNLGDLAEDDRVDLERPLAATGRFDGHIVQGHVDGVAVVSAISPEGGSRRFTFTVDPAIMRYVVEKGSVAVDGVSLTVTAAGADWFEIVLIPHTLGVTVFGNRRVGDRVNVEVDILAKYVERLLEGRS